MGFTGLALGAMLAREGIAQAAGPRTRAVRPPVAKAKAVIWIFLCGGVSHVESFDPKPALNRYAGKSIESTPYKDVLNPARLKDVVSANPNHGGRKILMGLNTGFRKYGAVRAGGRRLVATRRLVCRRHRGGALALDDGQRPRGAAPVPHRPARARGGPSRRSARGSRTAWARSTKTCRSTSCWASRPAIAAAARGPTARPTSGRSTPASGSIPTPRSRCRSSRRARA